MVLGVRCGHRFDEFRRHLFCRHLGQKVPAKRLCKQLQDRIFGKVRAVEQSFVDSPLTGVLFQKRGQLLGVNQAGTPGSLYK
ncbi:MAG: hypothetical protein ACYTFQ_22015 [Planctomycetota bacterium]|jgi:hypothetical protein